MSLSPRPELENLKLCPHGGINYAELSAMGITPEAVLDFSVCTNPFMPPPGIRQIFDNAAIDKYPDSEATELRQRLSEGMEITPDNVLVGSGTTELIRLVALAYFRQGDSVLIPEPTYGEYEIACQIVGAKPVKQRMKALDNFVLKIEETGDLIKRHNARAVFICNPNNPTGKYVSRREIEMVVYVLGGSLLILDEAYVNFVNNSWSSIDLVSRGNVIILRSMTKDYGLAGLRLGYAVASQEVIDNLRRVCPPWNVNAVAQKAGLVALEAPDYLEWSKKKIGEARQFLIEGLSHLGLPALPSDAHYFLVKVDNAKSFRNALLMHGILVRDCTSLGLPEYVRIAPRTIPECRKLIDTISELKNKGELKANGKII